VDPTPRQTEAPGAGYLSFQSTTDGDEWAALLVVGPSGLPAEFLYSGPLRPTPVQAILYQDRLAGEVRLSLVRSLVRGIRSRPSFVGLRAEDLGPGFEREFRCPLLVVEGETGAWAGEAGAAPEAMRRRLEEAVGIAEPLGRARAALAYVVEYERSRHADKEA
jgi:hypothetical protein